MAIVFGLLGLIIGSFLNVLILRRNFSSLGGRSHCMSCRAQIEWYDNIPLISWIVLRGHCRLCRSSISAQYPIVEALTAGLFALAGAAPALLLAERFVLCVIISISIAIAFYDIRHTIIPDEWVFPLACFSLAFGMMYFADIIPPILLLISGPIAAAPLFLLWLISGGRWMGFGDVKLAISIGWLLGPWYGSIAILGAFILGAVVSVLLLVLLPRLLAWLRSSGITRLSLGTTRLTMKSEVPFGPFLIASQLFICLTLLYHIPLPV